MSKKEKAPAGVPAPTRAEGKGLATDFPYEDERSIRRRIQQERKDGKLIMADCQHGYFLPEGESDVRRFIGSMSNRAKEITAVSRAAEDALLKLTGQETFKGW